MIIVHNVETYTGRSSIISATQNIYHRLADSTYASGTGLQVCNNLGCDMNEQGDTMDKLNA